MFQVYSKVIQFCVCVCVFLCVCVSVCVSLCVCVSVCVSVLFFLASQPSILYCLRIVVCLKEKSSKQTVGITSVNSRILFPQVVNSPEAPC